jgi:hypothetical protein
MQINFLTYMLQIDKLPPNITELAREAQIDKSTFYKWIRELGFIEAFNKVCDVKDALVRPWVDASNHEQALAGNIGAQRTYYMRRGLLNQGNSTTQAVQVNIGDVSKVG